MGRDFQPGDHLKPAVIKIRLLEAGGLPTSIIWSTKVFCRLKPPQPGVCLWAGGDGGRHRSLKDRGVKEAGWLSMGRVVQAAAGHAVWGDADTQQLDLVWPSGSTSQFSQTSMGKRFQIARSFISEDAAHFEVDGHVANAADDVRLPFRLQVFRQNFSYDSLLAEGELDLAPLIAAAPRDQAETKTLVDVVAIARSAGGSSSSVTGGRLRPAKTWHGFAWGTRNAGRAREIWVRGASRTCCLDDQA